MTEFVKPVAPPAGSVPSEGDRSWAMLTHLSGFMCYMGLGPVAIVAPLILWLSKRDESAYVDDHGREALNFNITIWLYAFLAGILTFAGIGCVLLPVLLVFHLIVVIQAAIGANRGEYYRYPITIRFIS